MKDFRDLELTLKDRGVCRRLAVVWGADTTTRAAVAMAIESGLAEAWFIGCADEVLSDSDLSRFPDKVHTVEATDCDDAAAIGVNMIREGKADILMKGLLNTDNLLRAVLNKEYGILPKDTVLTHITAASIPAYDRILLFTDVAVIPYPTDAQRHAQVTYAIDIARRLGISRPGIALIHCSEKVDERHFPFTADYVRLKQMAADGDFGPCVIDGPMDVKTACSAEALRKKGMVSPLNGESDILVFPDIEAGNTFYKTLTLFGNATVAGMLCGAMAPVILASRGDSARSKYNSILLASF